MKHSKTITVLFILVLSLTACKNTTPKPNAALASIEFLRGDLLLCGDGQFGTLKFSLSCSYETRETFDLAVALLHSFQYGEAEKAFVKVIDADPNCPMAYWGVAMSIYHAAWFPPTEEDLIKGAQVLAVAKELTMDEKQRDYIQAIDAFYTNWDNVDHNERAIRYEKKMEQLSLKYPEDVEAAIFYSLALFSTRDRVGKTYENELKAGKILESLFADNPDHPGIAHYIIHNYDNPVLAEKALKTARKYAKIAPSSAHAQHMPSHIFTRLGIWEESIASNLASAESAKCYTEARSFKGGYYEELHALDYLVYAYLQRGDTVNAKTYLDQIKDLKTVHPAGISASMYSVAAIPARMALENKNWERAANLELQNLEVDWQKFPWQKAIHHFAKAMGAAHLKDFGSAEIEIDILKKLHQNLIAQQDRSKHIQVKQVEIQMKTAQAWVLFSKGDIKRAVSLMQEAVAIENKTSKHPVTPGDVLPAIELLGDMFLEMGRNKEALAAYQENLKAHPNRFNGIYGAARAAKKTDDVVKAMQYYNALLELVVETGQDREELKEAREFIEQQIL